MNNHRRIVYLYHRPLTDNNSFCIINLQVIMINKKYKAMLCFRCIYVLYVCRHVFRWVIADSWKMSELVATVFLSKFQKWFVIAFFSGLRECDWLKVTQRVTLDLMIFWFLTHCLYQTGSSASDTKTKSYFGVWENKYVVMTLFKDLLLSLDPSFLFSMQLSYIFMWKWKST